MRPRILLTGGGTGGHLFPALNLATALRRARPDVEVMFLGARRGLEASVLPDSGWPYRLLPLEPLYRSRPWRNWRFFGRLPAVAAGLRRLFRDFDPNLVVGTGGYVSGPAVAWAGATDRKTALQEQNAMPGLVTRVLASRVDQLHLGYPETRERLRPGRRTSVFDFGNPVAIEAPLHRFDWPEGRIVAVVGGSQGARGLNERLLSELTAPVDWPADVSVVWAAGRAHHASVAERAKRIRGADRVRVVPFIADLGAQLHRVSLAVCRSGAMFCSELAAAGVPAVFVPFPAAAGDHQRYNARALVDAGAALMREEAGLGSGDLWESVLELLREEQRLARMAAAMRSRGRPDAASRIAAELLRLADQPEGGADA